MNNISTLTDFVTDYLDSNFSVRPDTLDSVAGKVRLAVVELQKSNVFPETTISFESLDMKEEKRDSAGKLIYNYYDLPEDFRQLYNNGPAFQVDGSEKYYDFVPYGTFLQTFDGRGDPVFTIHRFNGEFGKRNRLIAAPFPQDADTVHITYYSNGVDMPMELIDETYYMPVINHVLNQLGLRSAREFKDDINTLKRNRQDPAGQGSHHQSFTRTRPRFFGRHR